MADKKNPTVEELMEAIDGASMEPEGTDPSRDTPQEKPINTLLSEGPDGEVFQIFQLEDPSEFFYIGKEDELPDHIVLVNFKLKMGFAMPFEVAHKFSHLIHDGLEVLTGGELHENETETKKITTH